MSLPETEYAGRLARARASAREEGFDALYVSAPANVAYFSGLRITPHERLIALVVPTEGEPVLVVPSLEAESARENRAGIEVLAWEDAEGPFGAVRSALERAGAREPALEKDVVTVRVLEALQDILGSRSFADGSPLLTALRMRKSPAELALLERAAEILDASIGEVPGMLRPGRTEADVAFELDRVVRENGAHGRPFETIVLGGPNAALPHGRPGARELGAGELVIVDVGAVYEGYCADMTRTFVLGEAGDGTSELHEVVRRAQEAGCAAVRPGASCSAVDAAARAVIEEAGYGEAFVHRTGHGLGLEVHEPPSLVAGNDLALEPGMVVTVEPGVYLPGVAGVRIEDDVAVVEGGSRRLTRAERALVVGAG